METRRIGSRNWWSLSQRFQRCQTQARPVAIGAALKCSFGTAASQSSTGQKAQVAANSVVPRQEADEKVNLGCY